MPFPTLLLGIALLPLGGAILNGLIGRRLSRRAVALIACGMTAASFLLALIAFGQLLQMSPDESKLLSFNYFRWIQSDSFVANFGFMFDQLTAVMILVVTGIGFLIHIYSTGYMAHEGGYYRFFAYLNLFMFSMLTLVLANNFVLMFVGWEGVGLCSYLLIGFYFQKKSAGDAGKKAFIVNRVGDFGFTLGIFLIFTTFGSVDFSQVFEAVKSGAAGGTIAVGDGVMTAICLLLFVGATGKSAQLPLYVWLPDAMEGPTPVSALIHAATMVTAGVYMVARCNALFVMAPQAMGVVAVVGAATAIFAASIGLVQNDIKRVLAYSTVSQLGYMFLGLGVGAFTAGIFHLMTHAFFKALLFLGSGSVIHALGGEQDIRKMGGLKGKIRTTWWTMLVGTVAIAGFPPLAGFFSKDEILWQAYTSPAGALGVVVGGSGGGGDDVVLHVSDDVSDVLREEPDDGGGGASCARIAGEHDGTVDGVGGGVGGGGLGGIPHVLGKTLGELPNGIERFLEPVFEHPVKLGGGPESETTEWLLMGVSVGIALVGLLLARSFYLKNPALPERLMTRYRALYTTLLNKYWVDEIYDALFVRPMKIASTYLLWKFCDVILIDGAVNGAAEIVRGSGGILRRLQSGSTRSYAAWILFGAVIVVFCFSFFRS